MCESKRRRKSTTVRRRPLNNNPAFMECAMNKLSVVVLSALCIAAAASAQTSDRQGVTEDTGPARAAAVERHAQELRAQQSMAHSMHRGEMHRGMHASTAHAHHPHHRAHHTAHKTHKSHRKSLAKSPA
jgi:hypothetical protein